MTWWTEQSGKAIQIKQKSRFIVEISSGFFLPNVKSCSKPSANVEIKEYQLINHIFKYPGIVKWNDIKISMVDMGGTSDDVFMGNDGRLIDPALSYALDTSVLLWRMLKHTGYNFPTEVDEKRIALTGTPRDLTTPEKASTIANAFGGGLTGDGDFGAAGVGLKSNKQSVRIYQLDPEGYVVEEWVLHNPQIKSINWGDLSYDDDAPVEYTLDICYDWAQLMDKKKNATLKTVASKYEEFMKKYFNTYGNQN
jgi:hypothetical protein